eukprot:7303502-Alexandrium_andersonii.AAC.1
MVFSLGSYLGNELAGCDLFDLSVALDTKLEQALVVTLLLDTGAMLAPPLSSTSYRNLHVQFMRRDHVDVVASPLVSGTDRSITSDLGPLAHTTDDQLMADVLGRGHVDRLVVRALDCIPLSLDSSLVLAVSRTSELTAQRQKKRKA